MTSRRAVTVVLGAWVALTLLAISCDWQPPRVFAESRLGFCTMGLRSARPPPRFDAITQERVDGLCLGEGVRVRRVDGDAIRLVVNEGRWAWGPGPEASVEITRADWARVEARRCAPEPCPPTAD